MGALNEKTTGGGNRAMAQDSISSRNRTTISRLSPIDEADLSEHVEIEQPIRAKSLHDREQDAKHRLRDAIVANGLTPERGSPPN